MSLVCVRCRRPIFVVLGQSTSKMSIREMSDLMELMSAFGAERGVRFTAPEYA
ncbi:MAG: recombination protein NinB [Uliginosibacterium sp.]|nr:recombination protein NinB [Uliginosibacterium sp.]